MRSWGADSRGRSSEDAKRTKRRAFLLLLFHACFLTIIVVRLFDLQIRQHKLLSADAVRQQRRYIHLPPGRGNILDRNGRELAVSLRSCSFFAHPSLVQDVARTSTCLASTLGIPYQEAYKKLNAGKRYVWIKRMVDPERAKAVLDRTLAGVFVAEESKRHYPKGELASHVLGFVGLDGEGLEGLEFSQDPYLKGVAGTPLGYYDALGRLTLREAEADVSLGNCDLILTIDEVIQYFAERALDKAVAASKAKAGCIIVMDPQTGEVLAMADRPTFDPNRFQNYPPAFRRNRAITDAYEPGSTFKVIMAAGALEEKVTNPGERIYCEMGGISLYGRYIRDFRKYGTLTFSEVLENSSNVGAIKAGTRLGRDRLHYYIRRFGFGAPTGIELPGEARGIVRRVEDWSALSPATISIGQEISVTPLQLLTAFCAIANGGDLPRPYVVRTVRGPHGELLRERSPQFVRRVISPDTASSLRDMLVKVVERGTGKRAAIAGWTVAGKTGTSQKLEEGTGQYSHQKVVASFAGFVPAYSPRLAILVMIDEPQAGSWGGTLAAPVFAELAQESLQYLGMKPAREDALASGKGLHETPRAH